MFVKKWICSYDAIWLCSCYKNDVYIWCSVLLAFDTVSRHLTALHCLFYASDTSSGSPTWQQRRILQWQINPIVPVENVTLICNYVQQIISRLYLAGDRRHFSVRFLIYYFAVVRSYYCWFRFIKLIVFSCLWRVICSF